MGKRCLLLFPLCLTFINFFTGCVSNRVQIEAWRDSDFSPTRTNKIAIAVISHPRAEDAAPGRILLEELKHEHFDLVPFDQADYSLAGAVEDDSEESYTPSQQPFLQTPSSLVGQDDDPSTFRTRTTVFPPTLVVLHKKTIRLYLYNNPQTHLGVCK
jgi:hypothetical protein